MYEKLHPKYKMSELHGITGEKSSDSATFHDQEEKFDFGNEDFQNAMMAAAAATSSCMNNYQQQLKSIYTIAAKVNHRFPIETANLTEISKLPQTQFNVEAPPFEMPSAHYQNIPKIKIGPSEVEVNSNIWSTVASNRQLPHLQRMPQLSIASPPPPSPAIYQTLSSMVPSIGLLNAAAAANGFYNFNGVGFVS